MLYLTGDTHGTNDILKLSDNFFPAKNNLSRSDYVLITGDFGGIWSGDEKDGEVLDFYSSQPFTTLFIDGNHENFDLLNAYPIEEWNGGKIHRIRDNIIHLMRGQVFTIDGLTYFTFGGGLSIDKHLRKEHVSWWKEEYASEEEKEEALLNLEKHNNKVDFIVTHTCPRIVKDGVLSRCISLIGAKCDTEEFLDKILEKTDYRMWFCGHYHNDLYFEEYRILFMYHEIVEISAITNELSL